MRSELSNNELNIDPPRRQQGLLCVFVGFVVACSGTTGEDKEDPSVESAETPITAQPDIDCDYAEHAGHEYWFCRNNREWDVAKDKCAAVGMHLARIDDAAENSFIYDNIFHSSWIGATDEGGEGDWHWIDDDAEFWTGGRSGSAASGVFTNWDWWEPDDDQYQNCALINYYGGEWSDRYCGYEKDYVCESSADTDNYPQAPDTGCQLGSLNGHEYWFCSDRRSFSEARTNCQSVGMDLANVENEEENDFITNNIRRDSFIGLTDTEKEGVWKWLTDGRLAWCGDDDGRAPGSAAYTNWHSSWFYGYPTVGAECRYETASERGYWFCDDGRPWSRARSACESVGMSLARIDDEPENEYFYENIYWDVWLGATDEAEEGEWKWLYGDELFWAGGYHGAPVGGLYNHWAWGGPMDFHWADCLALSSWWGDWESWDCEDYLAWVCEGEETDNPELPDTMDCAKMQSCGGEWVNDECEDLAGYVCETVPETAGQSLEDIAKWIRDDFRTGRPIIRHLEFEDTAEVTTPFLNFSERLGLRECIDTVEPTGSSKFSHFYGQDIARYRQLYKGVPVYTGGYSVHREPGGENVRRFTGLVEHYIELDINPTVSEPDAFGLAIAAIGTDSSDYSPRPEGKLMIIPKRQAADTDWRLTWLFAMPTTEDSEGYTIGIDAHTGALAVRVSKRKYECRAADRDDSAQQATLNVQSLQQAWLDPDPEQVTVEQIQDGTYLLHTYGIDPVIDSTNEALLSIKPEIYAKCAYNDEGPRYVSIDSQTVVIDGGTPDVGDDGNAESRFGAAVFLGVERCVEFLSSISGVSTPEGTPWIGIDGTGDTPIPIQIYFEPELSGPFYQLGVLYFDFDFSELKPFYGASIEIPCHELVHGIVANTVPLLEGDVDLDLIEEDSVEEGFADIIASAAEMYVRGYPGPNGDGWCFPGDGFDNALCYRNFAEPNDSFNPYPYTQGKGCPRDYLGSSYCYQHDDQCSKSQQEECCDAHCNSTVLSHWFYLVTQGRELGLSEGECRYSVDPLGSDLPTSVHKGVQILFGAITDGYEKGMGFRGVAELTIDRAVNLYGVESDEVKTIVNAWYAVAVWEDFYEAHRSAIEPTRGEDEVYPWKTFSWPAEAEDELWDFQLSTSETFVETFAYVYGKDNIQATFQDDTTGKWYAKFDLALPFESSEQYYWRVRPHPLENEPWEYCYTIHSFEGTGELEDIGENIKVIKDNPDDEEVPPGTVMIVWDRVEGATSYKVQFARADGDCKETIEDVDFEAEVEDQDGIPMDLPVDEGETWVIAEGILPEADYWVHILPIGPEDYVGDDPVLREGICAKKTFRTAKMPPPDPQFPANGDLFFYQSPHEGLSSNVMDYPLSWKWWDTRQIASESTISFYHRDANGNCLNEIIATHPGVPVDSVAWTLEDDIFPAPSTDGSAPNTTGYCWDVFFTAANGSTSDRAEKREFDWVVRPVSQVAPGNIMSDVGHDIGYVSGAILDDSWGNPVELFWNAVPNALKYVVRLTHYETFWEPIGAQVPINVYDDHGIDWNRNGWFKEEEVLAPATSLPLTGEEAGHGRYCWEVWPVVEDPQGVGQPLVALGDPYCYTTGPSNVDFDIETDTDAQGKYTPGIDIKGIVAIEYVPDMQIDFVWPDNAIIEFDEEKICEAGGKYNFYDLLGCEIGFTIKNPAKDETFTIEVRRWNCLDATIGDECEILPSIVKEIETGSCGGLGEECCAGDDVEDCNNTDLDCDEEANVCEKICGSDTLPCCDFLEPDCANSVCVTVDEEDICQCGGQDQPPCANGNCDDGYEKLEDENGVHYCNFICGEIGEPCCSTGCNSTANICDDETELCRVKKGPDLKIHAPEDSSPECKMSTHIGDYASVAYIENVGEKPASYNGVIEVSVLGNCWEHSFLCPGPLGPDEKLHLIDCGNFEPYSIDCSLVMTLKVDENDYIAEENESNNTDSCNIN